MPPGASSTLQDSRSFHPAARASARVCGAMLLATVVAVLSSGCSSIQNEAGIARPPENVPVTELTGTRDYERLRGLGATRGTSDPRDGYRIGPDDLLEVRVPDLLENGSRSLTDGASGVVLQTVRETPLFQQGVRVTSHGTITLPLLGEFKAEGLDDDRARGRHQAAAGARRHPTQAAGQRAARRVPQRHRRGDG